MIVLLLLPICLFIALGFLLNKRNLPAAPADVTLVFGTYIEWKARSRWLRAAEIYHQGLSHCLIVSGGVRVPGQPLTEAEWFRDHLVALGVPAEKILLENRARTTPENAAFTLPLLKEHAFQSVILVMSDYTGRRADLAAKKAWQGYSVAIYNAHASSGWHWSPWTWWLHPEGWKFTLYSINRLVAEDLLRYLGGSGVNPAR
jgi:uncharacterized SAM-binding protein YcdF (DUF218 family)